MSTEFMKSVSQDRLTEQQFAERLVEQAKTDGVDLVGPGGLLSDLTKAVLETALEVEMSEHLGYDKHAVEGRNNGNSRNGARTKTVLTEAGPVAIEVPRDRDGSFEPKTVKKHSRRMPGVDELVISKITDKVLAEMTDWQNRPLDTVYPVVFIDAMVVKIRDGLVANRPIYCAIGVTVDGERDILGPWVGTGGEGAKYWQQVLTEIKNRGVKDVCIVVSDGLTGISESITATWPEAIHQTCVLHLIRNTFRYASKADWPAIAAGLRPVYQAPTEAAARQRFEDFDEKWGRKYPAITKLWGSAWAEFVPFLQFDPEIRSVVYSTNAIESIHARFRRAVRARGHFPTENAALKCVYLTVRSLDPTGKGRQRWMNRWKQPLNAFAVTFEGRILNPSN